MTLTLKPVADTAYTKGLYVLTRNNTQLGNALSEEHALIVYNWLNSINSYYDEDESEWRLE